MASRVSFPETLLRHPHGLIGKSLQPQHPRQEHRDQEAKVHAEPDDIAKSDDIPSEIASGTLRQQLFQPVPRIHLIADEVLGYCYHALAEHLIVLIRAAQGERVELQREGLRGAKAAQ